MSRDKIWVTAVLFLVSIPFVANILIDGNKIFGVPLVATKPYFQNEVFFKLRKVENSNYENLIMGSSAAGSLDPFVLDKYGFAKDKTYNLGISDASIFDLWKIFQFVVQKTHVKTVFLGINFLSFNPSRLAPEKRRNYNFNYFKIYIKNIFSTEAFLISKETIEANRGTYMNRYMDFERGQYVFGYPKPLNENEPYYMDFIRLQVRDTLTNPVYLGDDILKDFSPFDKPFHYFDKILTLAKEKHIKIYLFAPLVHFILGDLIYGRGFGNAFEKWVKAVTQRHEFYCYLCSTTLSHDNSNFIDFVHLHPHTSKRIFKIMFEKDPLFDEVFLNKNNVEERLRKRREGVKTSYLESLIKSSFVDKEQPLAP